jgi:hypothetical protein
MQPFLAGEASLRELAMADRRLALAGVGLWTRSRCQALLIKDASDPGCVKTRKIETRLKHPSLKLKRTVVAEVVLAFLRREVVDENGDSSPEIIDGSFCCLSQSGFELGEGQFDGV